MCLIENELLKHGVFSHIVKQIIKFIVAFKNDETKKVLRNLFLTKIKEEKAKYIEKFKKYYNYIEEIDIFEIVENIIDSDPELYIFIDNIDDDLQDFCLILQDSIDIKAIMVLKLKGNGKVHYTFYDEEYSFIRGETQPIKESKASEKYWNIFYELIEEFKKAKLGSTNRSSSRDSWLGLPVGTTGIHLEWYFTGREPEKKLEICLHFETKDPEINHKVFEFFAEKENEFKKLYKEEVHFEKYWLHNGDWSNIYIRKEVGTLENFIVNQNLKQWALINMVKLYDFYMQYVEDVRTIINTLKTR